MAFWIYMLRCSDDSFYVGHTDNIELRIAQHNAGAFPACYTFDRRPLRLVFTQDFPTREGALAMERRVKGWSRAKKNALIKGDWAEISRLARLKKAHLSAEQPRENKDPSTLRQAQGSLRQAQGERNRAQSAHPEIAEGSKIGKGVGRT